MKAKIAVIMMLTSLIFFGIGGSIEEDYGTYIFGVGFLILGIGILLCREWAYAEWAVIMIGLGFVLPGLAMIVLTYGYLEFIYVQ